MSHSTNLVYNGDFSYGTDSWSSSSGTVSAENGILTVNKGELIQNTNYLFPVANGRKYRLSFDLKINTKDSNSWYIALRCYDSNKQNIDIQTVNKVANTNTTLAAAVANGATSVQLTSSANWNTATSHHVIGICDKKAWGYNRLRLSTGYKTGTISNNTLTLNSAWTLGSFAAGTPVACFLSGSTYYYPIIISNANLPTEWTTYTTEFNGGDAMRYSTKYVQFGTLGYTMNYSMRNIKIECISDYQTVDWENQNIDIKKTSIIEAGCFNEIGMKIRYVRDTTTGSTANTANHWCEFKIINSVGENIAWGKDVKNESGTVYSNSYGTDGIVNSNYLDLGSGTHSAIIDLGYIEDIYEIQIWHYYPDGRTYYNNVTEVSLDGINWHTVYSGQKPETSTGNIIYLKPYQTQFYKSGIVSARNFYEI